MYLGTQSVREAKRKIDFDKMQVSTARNPVLVGYFVNISNPIAIVWWVGVFGSLLGASEGGATLTNALLSSSTILIGILLWHSTTSILTHWGKRLLSETTAKYINVIAGSVLILFGIRFAYNAVIIIFT